MKLTKEKESRYITLACRHVSPREEAEMHCQHPITMLPRAMQMKARTIVLVAHFMKLDSNQPMFAHSYVLRFSSEKGWQFCNAGSEPRSIEHADDAIDDLKYATHIKWYTWEETDQTHLQPEKAKTTSSTKESVPTQQPVTVKQTHLNCENVAAQKN